MLSRYNKQTTLQNTRWHHRDFAWIVGPGENTDSFCFFFSFFVFVEILLFNTFFDR